MKIRFSFALLATAAAAVASLGRAEFFSFNYDTAGRLTSATYGFGKSAAFQYDATGNLTRSQVSVIADSDNDGLVDSWETNYFHDLSRDGSGDFDGDGFSDLAEFLAGTLPNDGSSLLRMRRVTNTVVQTTVTWDSVSGKSYRVQFKDRLTDAGWNDLPGDVSASGATASKTDATSIGQPQRFYRVQVLP